MVWRCIHSVYYFAMIVCDDRCIGGVLGWQFQLRFFRYQQCMLLRRFVFEMCILLINRGQSIDSLQYPFYMMDSWQSPPAEYRGWYDVGILYSELMFYFAILSFDLLYCISSYRRQYNTNKYISLSNSQPFKVLHKLLIQGG